MRPGSCENIIWPIIQSRLGDAAASAVELVSNPEFLREATGIEDFFHAPKIVIGTLGRSGTRIFSLMTAGKKVMGNLSQIKYRACRIGKLHSESEASFLLYRWCKSNFR